VDGSFQSQIKKMSCSVKEEAEEIGKMLPIRMISTVVHGFGRGSHDLGIPTANLDRALLKSSCPFDDLPCGIYWGFCRIGEKNPAETDAVSGVVYKAAISIGYNPTYGNKEKTVEPHLIASESDPRRHASSTGETLLQDFYDQPVRVSVVGYLRPELPFEGLEKLVVAIKKDISKTELLGDSTDVMPVKEKEWVGSDRPVR
jgi:riboflavin kinase